MLPVTETTYPASFRSSDVQRLAELISHHTSAVVIGMKRVGVNNFLKFFLHHQTVQKTYFSKDKHIFIAVDLNDMVEREVYPFWILVLKRLVDTVETATVTDELKQTAKHLFVESIQLNNLFVTLDSCQKILAALVSEGFSPTLFLLRFDRLKDAITLEFFNNLMGLKEATHQKLTYVFTSYRPLTELAPAVFKKAAMTVFSKDLYVLPAQTVDSEAIFDTLASRYKLTPSKMVKKDIIGVSGGHVQYIQLALLRLLENHLDDKVLDVPKVLLSDEQVTLQSEELWESLSDAERRIVTLILEGKQLKEKDTKEASYLWDTGIVRQTDRLVQVFSPLLSEYIKKVAHIKPSDGQDFTKKELLLIKLLQSEEGRIFEREEIIDAVWPEAGDFSVSDWAIDRLVSRVRAKLKSQQSQYEIVTVVTRGYKMTKK